MNGTIIRQSETRPREHGTRPFSVILWRREHALHPYVVHFQAEDGEEDRWWGSYCATLEEACREFDRRCAAHGLPANNLNWPH